MIPFWNLHGFTSKNGAEGFTGMPSFYSGSPFAFTGMQGAFGQGSTPNEGQGRDYGANWYSGGYGTPMRPALMRGTRPPSPGPFAPAAADPGQAQFAAAFGPHPAAPPAAQPQASAAAPVTSELEQIRSRVDQLFKFLDPGYTPEGGWGRAYNAAGRVESTDPRSRLPGYAVADDAWSNRWKRLMGGSPQ